MDNERLNTIYDKTDGHCHLCHGKVCFSNYGRIGTRGAWEVEHSKAQANNGSHHLNNLYPAHISCNRAKGKRHTKTIRAQNGVTRAPRSQAQKEAIRDTNTAIGMIGGILYGCKTNNLLGIAFWGFVGAKIGKSITVNR